MHQRRSEIFIILKLYLEEPVKNKVQKMFKLLCVSVSSGFETQPSEQNTYLCFRDFGVLAMSGFIPFSLK